MEREGRWYINKHTEQRTSLYLEMKHPPEDTTIQLAESPVAV